MAYTTIKKPNLYFTPFTFTGSGSAGTRTGVGFTPDMFIHKNRDNTQGWGVIDVIRGNGNYISTNTTNAELSDVGVYGITTDGYTFPNGDSFFNGSGNNMAYWNWKAGGTGVSNTDGEQSATVSANTTSGFSIIKWTGNASGAKSTVGHGLGVTPNVFITKKTNDTSSWIVYHSAMDTTGDYYLNLENNIAKTNYNEVFGDGMTSSVCGLSGFHTTGTYVGYAFAEKKGFSKFGSYTGNGNADGTFVYTGFKPAFVIMKRTDTTENWLIKDSVRDSFNVADKRLFANLNQAEGTSANGSIDILSNGFKQRGSDIITNASGGTYIYMAFAEEPLVGDNPATAR